MIVACHQPNFIPWPGFFYKALQADILVLLDNVQFPISTSWVNRNRIKTAAGSLWLTVPVWRKGRTLQKIKDVEICNDLVWGRKHYLSILHAYSKAPYLGEHVDFFQAVFANRYRWLIDFNLKILEYLKQQLRIKTEMILASHLGVEAKGTELLVQICQRLDAATYLCPSAGRKYIDAGKFQESRITVRYYNFTPPVYPQLWGSFIPNLSVIDLLLNCGSKSAEIINMA